MVSNSFDVLGNSKIILEDEGLDYGFSRLLFYCRRTGPCCVHRCAFSASFFQNLIKTFSFNISFFCSFLSSSAFIPNNAHPGGLRRKGKDDIGKAKGRVGIDAGLSGRDAGWNTNGIRAGFPAARFYQQLQVKHP